MNRKLLPERAYYAVGRGPPVAPSSAQRVTSDNPRLTAGASVLIILLSSLGLWAMIWAVVASFV
jgi:hypothetical protein